MRDLLGLLSMISADIVHEQKDSTANDQDELVVADSVRQLRMDALISHCAKWTPDGTVVLESALSAPSTPCAPSATHSFA